jgi:hypothetical protein
LVDVDLTVPNGVARGDDERTWLTSDHRHRQNPHD